MTLSTEDLEISMPADMAELADCLELWRRAFMFQPPAEYETPAQAGFVNPRVLFKDGRVAAMLDLLQMGQWFGGRSVPMAGLRGVAVAPEHRSAGLGSHLIRKVLEEMREAGFPLSALYPSREPFYRRLGYERAGLRLTYRVPVSAIPAQPEAANVTLRPIAEPDRAALVEAYHQRATRTAGNLNRVVWLWERLLKPQDGPACGYLVEREGRVEGYVVYTQRRGGQRAYDLHVQDLVALTPQAGHRLLELFADHRGLAEAVLWPCGPAEPLLLPISDMDMSVEKRQAWMLRLVDVEGALAARGYPAGLEAELHLEVRDDVLPWNAEKFVLEVSGGQGRVRKGGQGALAIDVRGLASLYAGHLSPQELLATGYLDGSEKDLSAAAAIFAGPAPWMPDMY